MTKAEFREYVKQKFKSAGFQAKKSIHYKYVEDEYLACFELDPSSYCKGYHCLYGAIALPSSTCYPLRGKYHYCANFLFPSDPAIELDLSLPKLEQHVKYTGICEYEKYTEDQINHYFEINIEHFLLPLYNSEFLFDYFRHDYRRFNYMHPNDIVNICKKAGINAQEVFMSFSKEHVDLLCRRAGIDTQDFCLSLVKE